MHWSSAAKRCADKHRRECLIPEDGQKLLAKAEEIAREAGRPQVVVLSVIAACVLVRSERQVLAAEAQS